MRILTYDTESDGLLEEATVLHCAVAVEGKDIHTFPPSRIQEFPDFLASYSDDGIIVCHNQTTHDLPLLEKLMGYEHKGKILDTLVFSKLLKPVGMRHSIEAYGEMFGHPKPPHEDWSRYSPEMLHRCTEDVKINKKVLQYLLKVAKINEEELACLPSY